MNTKQTITVDEANGLPHGTVRRAPTGFAHAILLDQMGAEAKWHIIDLYGPMETDVDAEVADWPIVYVPAPDQVWQIMNLGRKSPDPEFAEPIHGSLCSGLDGQCRSMHCARCGKPTGPQGHLECFPELKKIFENQQSATKGD